MSWLAIKRVLKAGFINFWRNGYVSLASLSVMSVTLIVIGMLIFGNGILQSILGQLKDKVDINVYFATTAAPEQIQTLQKSIAALPEVKEVKYLSREDVLAEFRNRHSGDEKILQSIDELGGNPFGAMLMVKAIDPERYDSIAKFVQSKQEEGTGEGSIISKINYFDNKKAIESLNHITDSASRFGSAVAILFAAITLLITFNTIGLAIYSAREEIAVMRLVGASTRYIRGPFMVTGTMYGIIAGVISLLILFGIAAWLGDDTAVFFGGTNLAGYYVSNFAQIFGIIMLSGVFLGATASILAVRKYLTI